MSSTTPRRYQDEHGLTLIELVVAFALLSIILAAAAGSLITFGRSAVDNERRVQATAVANRLHEELQALPWQDAALYEDELEALEDAPADVTAGLVVADGTFEGRELVLLEGPGSCPPPPATCTARRDLVPYSVPPVMTLDGHDYEVYQYVSWDSVNDGIKHFTTFLRWQVMGQTVTQRFDSQRAATAGEAGDPLRPRVIQFEVGPSPMPLVAPDGEVTLEDPRVDTATEPVNVIVRFSRGVQSAELTYWVIKDGHYFPASDPDAEPPVIAPVPELQKATIAMTGTLADPEDPALFVGFNVTLPAEHRFPNGPRTFRVTGTLNGEPYPGATTATFWSGTPFPQVLDPEETGQEPLPPVVQPPPGGGEGTPAQPVELSNALVSRTQVCLDANGRFYRAVKVDVLVKGMTPTDYSVRMQYTANKEQRVQAMEPPDPATVSPAGTVFSVTFPVGDSHGFKKNDRTKFSITASRVSDGKSAGPIETAQLTVRQPNRVDQDNSCL
ncbi:prepilin-type N-terminal cleavage/methylation domain-containing protein [Egicoccus sp. AB-alg2]|uniref:type IV pilus modification PilV family protein n=1 Tax=Egicoccus sp. AB-alg2 TaxID=3242693 RepID=UPI00359DA0FA